MKRLISLFLSFVMVMLLSVSAFATESASEVVIPKNLDTISLDSLPPAPQKGITRGWPGTGPAPGVTYVQIVQVGILDSSFGVGQYDGHVGVVVYVEGYGTSNATYDGRRVYSVGNQGVSFDGGPAMDAFYYFFDCGLPTIGNHNFNVRVMSINTPAIMSDSTTFDIY